VRPRTLAGGGCCRKSSASYPKSIGSEAISEATGYKRSTRDAYLQRLDARRLVVTELCRCARGAVRMNLLKGPPEHDQGVEGRHNGSCGRRW
jgi:hypothetical protein